MPSVKKTVSTKKKKPDPVKLPAAPVDHDVDVAREAVHSAKAQLKQARKVLKKAKADAKKAKKAKKAAGGGKKSSK